jgi:hypothetical protein
MELAEPEDGAIEQIVNYQPSGGPILLNQDLFEKMDITNQAALIAHEALYEFMRVHMGEANSLRVRRAVGYVFSDDHRFSTEHVDTRGWISCRSKEVAGNNGTLGSQDLIYISPDFLRYHIQDVGNTPLMGVLEKYDPSKLGNMLEQIFDNKCNNSGGMVWQNMPGPVEFDRSLTFFSSCKRGKKQIFLQMRKPGETEYSSTELTCDWRNK